MPRCQRTFLRLGNHVGKRDAADCETVWRCPHCADAEVYESVADTDLLAYARFAEQEHVRAFGAPPDAARSFSLLLGLRPECVLEQTDRRYDIYLQRGSDPFQLRLQIGHEMFHRVCSRGRVFHWTHEMLACLTSVVLLRRHGLTEYAERVDARYRREAAELSFEDMAATNLFGAGPGEFAPGFYGRAYITGVRLAETAGWPALSLLLRTARRDGSPDLRGWLQKLDPPQRDISAHIAGITWDTPK